MTIRPSLGQVYLAFLCGLLVVWLGLAVLAEQQPRFVPEHAPRLQGPGGQTYELRGNGEWILVR